MRPLISPQSGTVIGTVDKGRPQCSSTLCDEHQRTFRGRRLPCPLLPPVSTSIATYVAELLRRHLKEIGSRWRTLPTGRIAVLVLAVLRHDPHATDLASGNDVSDTTIRRWTREIIDLLAALCQRSCNSRERPHPGPRAWTAP